MDNNLRQLQRSGASGDPAAHIQWIRVKIRIGELSESMKRLLCALGYEPMVLALYLPIKNSSKQISFMKPKTFCAYKGGRWLLGIDYMRVAKYICKKHWSRKMSEEVLKNTVIDMRKLRPAFTELVDEIAQAGLMGAAVGCQLADDHYEIIDGQHRLRAAYGGSVHFYHVLAQQIRKQEVRDVLIKAILHRLA